MCSEDVDWPELGEKGRISVVGGIVRAQLHPKRKKKT